MATEAQIEANRRNSARSTGPRTQQGKNRSRLNALDHGCRANILVLPTEDPSLYEERSDAWRLSVRPRNPAEEYLVDRVASLSWKSERIDQAQAGLITRRIHHAEVDGADSEHEQVIALATELFQDAHAPRASQSHDDMGSSGTDDNARRVAAISPDVQGPMHLVYRLQTTRAGCKWLLARWAELRGLLERGVPWLGPDKLRAVRLLGYNPIGALHDLDVARVYLASHVLSNQGGQPFQDILDELPPADEASYGQALQLRQYDALLPRDAAAARQVLLGIVNRATEELQIKLGVLCKIAELDALSVAERASWDDSAEGERLRRYDVTCNRTWLRMFELLLKVRSTGEELDFAAVASIDRSVSARNIGPIDRPAPTAITVITPAAQPVKEPDPPIKANPVAEKAPNEANSSVPAPSSASRDGHKEIRIDTPHLERKAVGSGISSNEKMHPALQRLLTGRQPTLLDSSLIFGK